MMIYKSIGIRLEGTEAQLEEAVKRCRWAFSITQTPKYQASKDNPDLIYCYLRVYFYQSETPSPFDEIAALKMQNTELVAALGEAEQKIQQLQEQLDLIPKPRKYDAVLGTHQQQARQV